MDDTHTLTRHRDIQSWVCDRRGIPAIARVRDRFGTERSTLAIRFAHREVVPEQPSVDDGLSPVAWSAWLAELDRQGLALRVGRQRQFEFVERRESVGIN